MNFPKRKSPRLAGYDYGTNGAYFVTVCTKGKQKTLGRVVGKAALCLPQVQLTPLGRMVETYIQRTTAVYENVHLDKFVIMPNHIHMLLSLSYPDGGQGAARPTTVSDIVRVIKVMVRKEIGYSPFQSSFHDHIVRNEQDYLEHWNYIDENPAKWQEDPLYTE